LILATGEILELIFTSCGPLLELEGVSFTPHNKFFNLSSLVDIIFLIYGNKIII